MTASRPRPHRKCAFAAILILGLAPGAFPADGPGWRLTVVPAYERPAMHEKIPGSRTTSTTVARHAAYGELEHATTRGAWRWAREQAAKNGGTWIMEANIQFRRDADNVIDRILITSDDPLLPSITLTGALYERFEPLLGDNFLVVIPERHTVALYPRLDGGITPSESAALMEVHRNATYPVSPEVFRATREGLSTEGILVTE